MKGYLHVVGKVIPVYNPGEKVIALTFLYDRARKLYCITALEVSEYGSSSGPYFTVFGLNTKIHGVNLRIQSSKYGKIRFRKNSLFRHFSLIGYHFGFYF